MDGCSVVGVHNTHCFSNPDTAVYAAGWNKFLLLTTQKKHKLSYLEEMGYKKEQSKLHYDNMYFINN